MYENLTVETIKNDILSRLSTDINISEGSFTNDMVSTVAYEIWKYYQALNAMIPIAFVDETSGEYIDKRCAEYGLNRKAGTKATVHLTFTGTDDTKIDAGKVLLTADGLQFETDETVIITNGTAEVTATAAEIGDNYNVNANTIIYQLVTVSGLNSVTNTAATGGSDEETDAALVSRLYDYLQNPATSGNASHYRQWALAVDGVGSAKVMPVWNGSGTVKVLIVGNDNEPVDSTIVANCASYIEEKRPIGATVTVVSAEGLEVNVEAVVTLDSSTTASIVQSSFISALDTYLKSIAFSKYTLVYNRIAAMLLDIDGVTDYTILTVNGGNGNITIGPDQVPVPGSVEVTKHESD
jgi:Uncharacterized homolog of phage Mu protein gp47